VNRDEILLCLVQFFEVCVDKSGHRIYRLAKDLMDAITDDGGHYLNPNQSNSHSHHHHHNVAT